MVQHLFARVFRCDVDVLRYSLAVFGFDGFAVTVRNEGAGAPSARVPSGTWVASVSSAPAPTRQDSPTTTPCRQVDIDPIRVPLLTTAPSRWALWPTTQSSPDGVGVNEGGRIDVGVTVAEAVDGHSS